MKNVSQIFVTDEIEMDDEIDELFSQLAHKVPPTDMVERIMQAVSQLPLPQAKPTSSWSNLEELVVIYDPMQLC